MTLGALGTGIVAASMLACLGALYLLQYLYRRRERPGAAWFMGNIASVAIFCLSYGAALLVFDPILRITLEAVAFVCVGFMGPFFLAFGLEYTGRGNLIRTPLFSIVAAVPLLTTGLAATYPHHHLLWTAIQFDPVFGLATVTYTIQPWGIFALLFSIGTAAVGSLLLIGAILSYGPLYRPEAVAVTLSTVPPSVGVFIWMFDLGPVPELHLTAPLMLIHVTLDAYAFVGTHMFSTNPATQRVAERTSLNSLTDPVFILDTEHQIVRVNDYTEELFPATCSQRLPIDLDTAIGVGVDRLHETGELSVDGRTFAVSSTELAEPGDTTVGRMLILYDVTDERQREQQLAVLNRILRHNLRNETTVINGYAELLEAELEAPQHSIQAKKIGDASGRLLAIAEKARDFERIQQREKGAARLNVSEVVEEVAQTCSNMYTDADIEYTVTPPDPHLRTDPNLVRKLLQNLVENAIIHSDIAEPPVHILVTEASSADGYITFEIRDKNERIPDVEIETLREGDETPLQHGRGIGLWIVYWCVQKLHGTIDFEYDEGNVLTVTLPSI